MMALIFLSMSVSVPCCVSYSSIPDCIIFANNFDIMWHNTFMQSAAINCYCNLQKYPLSINFSWFLKYNKLSLAWKAIIAMIKKPFSLGCDLYIVNLDLTLWFHIMVCYTVFIRVFFLIQVEWVLHFSCEDAEALLILEIKWSFLVTRLNKLRTTYLLFVQSQR